MRSAIVAFVISFIVILLIGIQAEGRRAFASGPIWPGRVQYAEVGPSVSVPSIENFHAIRANGSFEVNVEVGPKASLTFRSIPEVMHQLKSSVKDGVLTIWRESGEFQANVPIVATITTTSLDDVTMNGSGNVDVKGIASSAFAATLNGSGNLKLVGRTEGATLTIDGSGDLDASHLNADNAEVQIAGSGNVGVRASNDLKATIAGSGNIRYLGRPSQIQQAIEGSGSISPSN